MSKVCSVDETICRTNKSTTTQSNIMCNTCSQPNINMASDSVNSLRKEIDQS